MSVFDDSEKYERRKEIERIEREIKQLEMEIRDRKRNTEAVIKKIGAKKILQSVRNEFISYIPGNIINEIRYWLM